MQVKTEGNEKIYSQKALNNYIKKYQSPNFQKQQENNSFLTPKQLSEIIGQQYKISLSINLAPKQDQSQQDLVGSKKYALLSQKLNTKKSKFYLSNKSVQNQTFQNLLVRNSQLRSPDQQKQKFANLATFCKKTQEINQNQLQPSLQKLDVNTPNYWMKSVKAYENFKNSVKSHSFQKINFSSFTQKKGKIIKNIKQNEESGKKNINLENSQQKKKQDSYSFQQAKFQKFQSTQFVKGKINVESDRKSTNYNNNNNNNYQKEFEYINYAKKSKKQVYKFKDNGQFKILKKQQSSSSSDEDDNKQNQLAYLSKKSQQKYIDFNDEFVSPQKIIKTEGNLYQTPEQDKSSVVKSVSRNFNYEKNLNSFENCSTQDKASNGSKSYGQNNQELVQFSEKETNKQVTNKKIFLKKQTSLLIIEQEEKDSLIKGSQKIIQHEENVEMQIFSSQKQQQKRSRLFMRSKTQKISIIKDDKEVETYVIEKFSCEKVEEINQNQKQDLKENEYSKQDNHIFNFQKDFFNQEEFQFDSKEKDNINLSTQEDQIKEFYNFQKQYNQGNLMEAADNLFYIENENEKQNQISNDDKKDLISINLNKGENQQKIEQKINCDNTYKKEKKPKIKKVQENKPVYDFDSSNLSSRNRYKSIPIFESQNNKQLSANQANRQQLNDVQKIVRQKITQNLDISKIRQDFEKISEFQQNQNYDSPKIVIKDASIVNTPYCEKKQEILKQRKEGKLRSHTIGYDLSKEEEIEHIKIKNLEFFSEYLNKLKRKWKRQISSFSRQNSQAIPFD
ncbi:hypothetical protein PPERSA_08569 [Pseudocohnilembus persalinus]|uniref:Uncharacterized protein n=1 Tax=Pseudocohnilembus persalinus TaxID=266149 RepID=A0A0V0R6M7_PSEPJ|nr:hypothetical protein PPERSA_08569 [Pseudocohnilembus persalinus]|eukprot:KRX10166.1 hypothetical protein PPERSA_08569 [Pseudocohnilembus persalinus]